jgi:two-component system cell cycle sensor histidine kinase/response regulator CckA
MPDGGLLVLACSTRGERACLEVRDSGHGIAPDVLPRIFDPFFTTKEAGKGTGLGLPSAMGIITAAGGTIEVESTSGQGTTFRVLLPPAQAAAESLVRNPTAPVTARRIARILLVEDDGQVRSVIEQVLKGAGHKVTSAGGGEEALAAIDAAESPFELLITDVVMPRMGGKRVLESARARLPGLKALFISGYAPDDQLLADIGASSANFLQKPFSISELQRKVAEVLG